jgi:hypothetical protein
VTAMPGACERCWEILFSRQHPSFSRRVLRPSFASRCGPLGTPRGMERRKAHPISAPARRGARLAIGALASRRSTCGSRHRPGGSCGSASGRASRTRGARAPLSSPASSSQTGHSARRPESRSRPGAGLRARPAGTAQPIPGCPGTGPGRRKPHLRPPRFPARSAFRIVSRRRPSKSEVGEAIDLDCVGNMILG